MDETAWTYLRNDDGVRARQYFQDSVQAYTDVTSVRRVGLSLVGPTATGSVENRPERAVLIAAAAEVYAHREGIGTAWPVRQVGYRPPRRDQHLTVKLQITKEGQQGSDPSTSPPSADGGTDQLSTSTILASAAARWTDSQPLIAAALVS